MPSSLVTVIGWIDKSIPNEENRHLIHKFVDFMRSTDTSEKYQRGNVMAIILFARHLGQDKRLADINRSDDILSFLDTLRKDVTVDPYKKWITTWNDYLHRIKYFMRWLHNGGDSVANAWAAAEEWQTPPFIQIRKKKTNRLSPYVESELWEKEDLLTIIKYESHKRNKTALTLLWDLDARNHEITLLKIKHVRLRERYGEAEIPHESKTGSGPALLMCSFPYVRDWINEHPFRNEPNARLICHLTKGGAISADALFSIMKQLRLRIVTLLESGSITDSQERENLDRLLKEKKWNPYCIRHSAITSDSDYLPDYALKKKVRWSMNSKQPSRYIKTRMGNDLKQKILVQNGIITEAEVKPTPTVADCARCQFVNALETKYCAKCGYPLSVSAYEELKAEDAKELNELKSTVEEHSRMLADAEDLILEARRIFKFMLRRRVDQMSPDELSAHQQMNDKLVNQMDTEDFNVWNGDEVYDLVRDLGVNPDLKRLTANPNIESK